jgi:aromatic-amino-acid transaminase
MAPRDPILGLTEAYNLDKNPKKVNLGVGVYYDDDGKVPLLRCVRRAEQDLVALAAPRSYLPIDGIAAYDKAVQTLVFGASSKAVASARVVTVQTLGGTGGLKVGADFLRRLLPKSQVLISDPSWENHRALFENAGFVVGNYLYYDASTRGVKFDALLDSLKCAPEGTIVVLHVCCHNPTGVDLSEAQWSQILAAAIEHKLVPFLDIAYQGFGDGLESDSFPVRLFAESGTPAFVSSSFSKSFSLYGERVGALSVIARDTDEAQRVLSQLKRIVRTNYSNPPTHGGQVVAKVLNSPELHALWEQELGQMRERIKTMRTRFVEGLKTHAPSANFEFVKQQRGMFSYSGLTKVQVTRLREEFGIYAVDSGRICVAALNSKNIDYVTSAVARVLAGAA